MSWIKRKLSQVTKNTQNNATSPTHSQNPNTIRYEVFKSHWAQIADIICLKDVDSTFITTNQTLLRQPRPVTQDDVDAVRNLLEQMILLLVEEQTSGLQLGPILEYLITNGLMNKMFQWYERSGDLQKQIAMNQIKIYEVLISQAQHSLLHHRQLVTPMLKLLSSCSEMNSEEVDSHIVLLLNLLCVWISRDPTLLEVFFGSSDDQGAANFLIFSLLITFIHREGSIGQAARDALLLCISMSAQNRRVADYIISTDFCPVLATGLSALYSSLPRQIDVRAEEWHFLRKQDWSQVPALVNFMNSFEFCNSVIEAACDIVGVTLLNYIYNGFLVSVFGPALHKPSASEVIVTTAYLNLFLQSVTAPELLQCFLRFLLCHRHDNSLIINTLIQRIGSSSRLAAVSLSLFRTLLDLDCEDLMLHLVFRYLIPCQHILASQHRSICDVDMYSASAHRFINLTPSCYRNQGLEENGPTVENHSSEFSDRKNVKYATAVDDTNQKKERSYSQTSAGSNNSNHSDQSSMITSPTTMAEFGPDHDSQMALHTSYMDYLENANAAITSCREACKNWSEPYDGKNPPTDAVSELKGLIGTMSPGVHRSAISLLSINDDEEHTKIHAESDPNPLHYDRVQGTPASPALHALNATYQALNATAHALKSKKLPMFNSNALDDTKEIDQAENEKDAILTNGVTKNSGKISTTEKNEFSVNGDAPNLNEEVGVGKFAVGRKHSKTLLTNELNVHEVVPLDEGTDSKPLSPAHSLSVDEFFRRLMESVPEKARNSIEGKLSSPDDREDQLEGERLNSMEDEEESEGFHDGVGSVNSDDESTISKSIEDPDDLGDDSLSVNSSFYEADLEYSPAEYSTPLLAPPLKMHAIPYTGPFLSTLFGKVDLMPNNSLYENLLLTGIISRLSCYTQPLLRSFLLNTHVVFHPAVRSLYQVLTGVRNRIDAYAGTVDDFSGLICRAEKYLLGRDSGSPELREENIIQDTPMPVPRVKTKNTVLGEVFLRRKRRGKSRISKLESLMEQRGRALTAEPMGVEGQSMFYASSNVPFSPLANNHNSDTETKNVVFASVIMHEFLKELAAISQEHAVTCA